MNNNALITETYVRMLPQMAQTHKSDKTYSADESSLRGKKRQLKIRLKGRKTVKVTTMNGSSELIKSNLPFHGDFFNKTLHY